MGKATSDRIPESRFAVEQNPLTPGRCDITFYVYDGTEDAADGEGKPVYVFSVYRLEGWPWRPTLAEDVEAHYDAWIAAAKEAEASAPQPTPEERNAADIAYLAMMTGVDL